ncbi:MAG: hypothetical protein GY755_13585 [Chloroflexi bacterium]|nr:hypothetical protein [Chloroflexota bacterium]
MKESIITALKANAIALLIFAVGAVVSALMNKFEFMLWAVYVATFFMLVSFIAREINERKNKKRYYFVSYSHTRGFGACNVEYDGVFDRIKIGKIIREAYFKKDEMIVVLNYKEISKKEYDINIKGDK